MNQKNQKCHFNFDGTFQLGVRFQNPAKKIVMEIFGQEYSNQQRIFLVGEIDRLFEPGYNGLHISEADLLLKLENKDIEIIK